MTQLSRRKIQDAIRKSNCPQLYEFGERLMKGEFEMDESPKEDPWVHRSSGMKCGSCMWFILKQALSPIPNRIGRCRRHAPTMNGYPVCYENDGCGDHKLDETKV